MRRSYPLIVAGITVAAVCGCGDDGPPMGNVSGTVTFDGDPLPDAIVEFTVQDRNGMPSYGRTDDNGFYELQFSATRDGAFVGTHKVRITLDAAEDEDGVPIPRDIVLAPRYNQETELKFDVQEGSNRADFELNSEE